MSYGIAIKTMFGFKEVTNQKIPHLVDRFDILPADGRSGSFAAPAGVTSSNGLAFTRYPFAFITFSGSTISWEYASSIYDSTTFNIEVLRF